MTLTIEQRIRRYPIEFRLAKSERDRKAIVGFAQTMMKKLLDAAQKPDDPRRRTALGLSAVAPRLAHITTRDGLDGEWNLGHRFMLAVQHGKIVGLNQFVRGEGNRLDSVFTCVAPDYRGRGLGAKIIRHTWAHAIRNDLEGVHSTLVTPESRQMYARLQAQQRGRVGRGAHIRVEGDFHHAYGAEASVSFRPRSVTRRRIRR